MIAQIVAEGQKRGEIDPRLNKEKVAIQTLADIHGHCSVLVVARGAGAQRVD